jgi:hypothetical protein
MLQVKPWAYVISPQGKAAHLLAESRPYGQGDPLWVGDTCWFGSLQARTKHEAKAELERRRQQVWERHHGK